MQNPFFFSTDCKLTQIVTLGHDEWHFVLRYNAADVILLCTARLTDSSANTASGLLQVSSHLEHCDSHFTTCLALIE